MGIVEVSGQSYHMNDNLIKKWDNVKQGKLKKTDSDRVYIADGRERTGKSLFTIQQSAFIDEEVVEDQKDGKILPRIPMDNASSWEVNSPWRKEATKRYKEGTLLPQITFSSKETLKAIRTYKSSENRTKVINFDEAFRGMSSKGVLSKENKRLVQALMEMGQSNLVLWIVSPSFFLLEFYPAVLRSNALFHVKKDKKSSKRVVRVFNYKKKAMLYQIGIRKGWGYNLKTKQNANFYNVYPAGKDFEWRYRLKKQLSLQDVDVVEVKEEHKWKKERDLMVKGLYKEIPSLRKLSKKLKDWEVNISHMQLSFILKGKEDNDNIKEKEEDEEQEETEID
jgi:hypothetical protein